MSANKSKIILSAVQTSRVESPRGAYSSMARLAHDLYEKGLEPREVLRLCYHVEFPEEFFVIVEAKPATLNLPVDFTNQPWKLAIPLDRGGPSPMPDSMEEIEQGIFAHDPDLVPLILLIDSYAKHGASIICYRLSELAAGRTTIFRIPRRFGPEDEIKCCGDSLLGVMHEHHTDIHQREEYRLNLPSNYGFGSIDQEYVDEMWEWVERIEKLQRQLSSSGS
jgi:hypothetical protein